MVSLPRQQLHAHDGKNIQFFCSWISSKQMTFLCYNDWVPVWRWIGVTSPQTAAFGNPDGRSAFLPTSVRPHTSRPLREVMWSAVWLRELLSALGLYMLSTIQHMPGAIRLSPTSRYLRPSSYLRHALLLGFSSSPSSPQTHSAMFVFSFISVHLFLFP